jgi:hypothetical protein
VNLRCDPPKLISGEMDISELDVTIPEEAA